MGAPTRAEADLALPTPASRLRAEVGPPRYDDHPSLKVGRRYNRVRWHYQRQNRRDTRELRKESYHKYQLQRRQIMQEERSSTSGKK